MNALLAVVTLVIWANDIDQPIMDRERAAEYAAMQAADADLW